MGAKAAGSVFWALSLVLFLTGRYRLHHITAVNVRKLLAPQSPKSVRQATQHLVPVCFVFYFSSTIITWVCDLQTQRDLWLRWLISRVSLLLSPKFSDHVHIRMVHKTAS